MTNQNSKGNGNDFSWIKPAVTPKPKFDLKKEDPAIWAFLQHSIQKNKKKENEKKRQNEELKKQAPKRLDSQVKLINDYLQQLKKALQQENQQLTINWSFVETESISNRGGCFNDIAGWNQHKDGQHDFQGPYDPQDTPPRAHGALQDTLYKTTVCKTCHLTLNNKKWQITAYPGSYDECLAVFTPTGFCSTISEVKAKIQEYIEKQLQQSAG